MNRTSFKAMNSRNQRQARQDLWLYINAVKWADGDVVLAAERLKTDVKTLLKLFKRFTRRHIGHLVLPDESEVYLGTVPAALRLAAIKILESVMDDYQARQSQTEAERE